MAYAEIEERQLGDKRWRVMIDRDGTRTLYASYETQAEAQAGLVLAKEYLAILVGEAVSEAVETLRDRFAMAYLAGRAAHFGGGTGSESEAAKTAYVYADAMLAAREVKP